MEVEAWESSSDGTADSEVDLQDIEDDEHLCMSGSIPKLQFRKDVSKARWDVEMGMAEVIEKKGGMWTTTGIVRRSKVYCSIEETLFLAERGALILFDINDMVLSLKDMYEMVAEGRSGCSWDSFEAYRHLKSLGYIIGRHGVNWSVKNDKICSSSTCIGGTEESSRISSTEMKEDFSITNHLGDMQINEKPAFDVYLPNSKFRKSSPGEPNFMVYLTRDNPPSKAEIESLERSCKGVPLKFCHVEHGRGYKNLHPVRTMRSPPRRLRHPGLTDRS
ncbi:tRNA-splicing endonuclease [Macleaya cordata]|uniref:tRNA-splicing endonuclease n=1 Tax=Macleaya cordata TaxID=56857 RepID=A0A200R137_MACCD|nr:tRNA-splicing endonuclease [Macleaya cordata]